MTSLPVTTLYAALLAIMFVFLAARVIRRRRASRIALGTGSDLMLQRLTRVHANFAEHVPFALILLMLAELDGYPRWILHIAGVALLGGRGLHAIGVSREREDFRLRVAGVVGTLGTIITLSLLLLGGMMFGSR